jgi:hypothetical protein
MRAGSECTALVISYKSVRVFFIISEYKLNRRYGNYVCYSDKIDPPFRKRLPFCITRHLHTSAV